MVFRWSLFAVLFSVITSATSVSSAAVYQPAANTPTFSSHHSQAHTEHWDILTSENSMEEEDAEGDALQLVPLALFEWLLQVPNPLNGPAVSACVSSLRLANNLSIHKMHCCYLI